MPVGPLHLALYADLTPQEIDVTHIYVSTVWELSKALAVERTPGYWLLATKAIARASALRSSRR